MGKIVLRNLFSRPATRRYPAQARAPFPNARGHMTFARMDDCVFCGLCAKNCPSKAIVVERAAKTNRVDHIRCIQCGVCVDVCPKKVIDMKPEYTKPSYTRDGHTETVVQSPKKDAAAKTGK